MPGCTATGGSGKRALGYLGHGVMANRSGLLIDTVLTPATGTAECQAALVVMSRRPGDHRITVRSDKGYDTRAFVAELRHLRATPHVAQCTPTSRRGRALDARTTRHPRYAVSQRKRKLVGTTIARGPTRGAGLARRLRPRIAGSHSRHETDFFSNLLSLITQRE